MSLCARDVVLVAALALLAVPAVNPCSSFITKRVSDDEGFVVAKSFDYDSPHGLVFVNKKDLKKTAVGQSKPRVWKSKYYSVTYNHYGRELPNSGMNSEGLVVEALILGDTKYPDEFWSPKDYDGSKGNVSNLQFVQYILDTSATLDEAIANTEKVQIMGRLRFKDEHFDEMVHTTPVHYAIYRRGEFVIVEYRDGHRWISPKLSWKGGAVNFGAVGGAADAPMVPVLTNSRYEDSVASLKAYDGFCQGAGCANKPLGWNTDVVTPSLKRFRYAAFAAKRGPAPATQSARDYGFAALKTVTDTNTVWRIVHVPKKQRIYWSTVKDGENVHVHTTKLDEIKEVDRVRKGLEDTLAAVVGPMHDAAGLGMTGNGWEQYSERFTTSFKVPGQEFVYDTPAEKGRFNFELLRKTLPHLLADMSENKKKAFAWWLTKAVNASIEVP